jgi:NIMA-interacting peptidyl-prolyl cis-trans isomerase 1
MELPPEWEIRESKSYPGRVFYHNRSTHQSTWIRPVPYAGASSEWPPVVCVSHILVKHLESSDTTTWKPKAISRSKENAKTKILNIRDDLTKGVRTFAQIATEESDCITSHQAGGDLGWIQRGTMPRRFDEIAFRMKMGEISGAVDTGLGWHLIWRRG